MNLKKLSAVIIASGIMAASMGMTASAVSYVQNSEGREILVGDVNLDNELSIVDSLLLFKSLSGTNPALTGDARLAADISKDDAIKIDDLFLLQRHISDSNYSLTVK